METHNIYEPPKSELTLPAGNEEELASRWARLGASMVDGILMALIMVPVLYMAGFYDRPLHGVQPPFVESLMAALFGIIVFFVINIWLLTNRGQTVGKKLLGIKIVTMEGTDINLNNIATRYAVYFLPGQIPIIGQLFSLVNILFIFGKGKRCLHDFAAKTQVIVTPPAS